MLTARWVIRAIPSPDTQANGHAWFHEKLDLTPEQSRQIEGFETEYQAERAKIIQNLNGEIQKLAEIIRTNESYTSEVTHGIHELHQVHGELQRLSIEHYYRMLQVLPPDQQERLRNMAVEALSEPE